MPLLYVFFIFWKVCYILSLLESFLALLCSVLPCGAWNSQPPQCVHLNNSISHYFKSRGDFLNLSNRHSACINIYLYLEISHVLNRISLEIQHRKWGPRFLKRCEILFTRWTLCGSLHPLQGHHRNWSGRREAAKQARLHLILESVICKSIETIAIQNVWD
jgi:hypothetical protein